MMDTELGGYRFSTRQECFKAVEYISKLPLTLMVVLLLNTDEIPRIREILEPLRRDLAASQGDGQICLLILNENQLHGKQFLQAFNSASLASSVSIVRYDGVLIANKQFKHPLETGQIADMVVAAQTQLKAHFVDLFSNFIASNYEILKSLFSESLNQESAVLRIKSADEWVRGKVRLSAVGKAHSLLNKMTAETSTKNARSNIRVRIRLLNGNNTIVSLKPSDALNSIVDEIIAQDPSMTSCGWILATAYPRRSFTDTDLQKTLADLNIESNTLIVVEPKGGYSISKESAFSGFFSYFIMWLLSIWDVIRSWFESPRELSSPATTNSMNINAENPFASRATNHLRRRVRNVADLNRHTSEDQPRTNEYFGGDSTAFLGGDE